MSSDAYIGTIQKGFSLVHLGRFSVFEFARGNSNTRKGPESLSGFGHKRPKLASGRTAGVVSEVRPAIFLGHNFS